MQYRVKGGSLRFNGRRIEPGGLVEISDHGQAKPLLDLNRVEPVEGGEASDDKAALLAALEEANKAHGGNIIIPDGTYDQAKAHSDLLEQIGEALAEVDGMPPFLDILSQVVWLAADHRAARGELAAQRAAVDDAPPPDPSPDPAPEAEPEPDPAAKAEPPKADPPPKPRGKK